jgi:hypothetical protein
MNSIGGKRITKEIKTKTWMEIPKPSRKLNNKVIPIIRSAKRVNSLFLVTDVR